MKLYAQLGCIQYRLKVMNKNGVRRTGAQAAQAGIGERRID